MTAQACGGSGRALRRGSGRANRVVRFQGARRSSSATGVGVAVGPAGPGPALAGAAVRHRRSPDPMTAGGREVGGAAVEVTSSLTGGGGEPFGILEGLEECACRRNLSLLCRRGRSQWSALGAIGRVGGIRFLSAAPGGRAMHAVLLGGGLSASERRARRRARWSAPAAAAVSRPLPELPSSRERGLRSRRRVACPARVRSGRANPWGTCQPGREEPRERGNGDVRWQRWAAAEPGSAIHGVSVATPLVGGPRAPPSARWARCHPRTPG